MSVQWRNVVVLHAIIYNGAWVTLYATSGAGRTTTTV